jgi:copper chaperone CopZ
MFKQKLSATLVLLAILIISISCNGRSQKTENESVQQEASLIEVSIGGMSCLGCEQTIQNNVSKLEGIKSVKASFTVGNAIIEYLPGVVDTSKIKEAVIGSGYTVKKFMPVKPEETAN